MSTKRPLFLAGLKRAAPLALPLLAFGASFGLLARQAGLSDVAAVTMSLTTFAGGAQFAAVGTLAAGGEWLSACFAATLINSRYLAMGVALAPAFTSSWWRRIVAAHFLVDESWLLSRNRRGRHRRQLFFAVGAAELVTWVLGTILGLMLAERLPDPRRLGLDMAVSAFFLAMLVPQLKLVSHRRIALLSALLAVGAASFGQPGAALLLVPVLVVVAGRRAER